jgi:hypothetical protein
MTPADTQSLKDAVARSGPAVLSLPVDGALRHHRVRFLMPEDQDGFWVEAPPGQRPLIDELLAGKKPVGVSLKAGDQKVIFTTLIREFESALPVGDTDTVVDAVLLAWPDQVQAVQRRNDYRVGVDPNDTDVHLRVWRIATTSATSPPPPPFLRSASATSASAASAWSTPPTRRPTPRASSPASAFASPSPTAAAPKN